MPESRRWFFDTVVLSNFALVRRLEILIRRYGRNGLVTTEVLAEISDGVVAGFTELRDVEAAIGTHLSMAPAMTAAERAEYRVLLGPLASGEASCIAATQHRGGVVVTDDRAARACCSDRRLAFSGTVGILRACCLDESLTPHDADDVLEAMVRAGFYAPVRRISDLL